MEITESVESINQRLIDYYGIDTFTSQPIWRVVWSEDQFEKRYGTYDDYTESGIWLRQVTEVREVPKYRQWIPEKYVLERLVVIPDVNKDELPDIKISYEPIFVFWDKDGNYLPPKFIVAQFVIDTIYAATGKKNLAKYKNHPDGYSKEEFVEAQRNRINEIQEYLYGDESGLMGTTLTGESIIVPQNYKKVN